MRAVIQRVSAASVSVEGQMKAACGPGLLVLLGVGAGDLPSDAERLAGKIARLRVFPGTGGRLDRSVLDIAGEVLVVSQFTLMTDARRQKGTRPDFSQAARPEVAEPLYLQFCEALRGDGLRVATGVFGATMQVELVNDGPVTMIMEV